MASKYYYYYLWCELIDGAAQPNCPRHGRMIGCHHQPNPCDVTVRNRRPRPWTITPQWSGAISPKPQTPPPQSRQCYPTATTNASPQSHQHYPPEVASANAIPPKPTPTPTLSTRSRCYPPKATNDIPPPPPPPSPPEADNAAAWGLRIQLCSAGRGGEFASVAQIVSSSSLA